MIKYYAAAKSEPQLITMYNKPKTAKLKAKDYAAAHADYSAALLALTDEGKDDDNTMAVVLHSNRAEALLQLRRFPEAAEAAKAALSLDPGHAKSKQRLQRAESGLEKVAKEKWKKDQQRKTRAAEATDDIEEFLTSGYIELQKTSSRR